MPELVACPACGCRFQITEAHLGRRTRCFACQHVFEAGAEVPPERRGGAGATPTRDPQPLCPECGRPGGWEDRECASCGEPFESEGNGTADPGNPFRRRDCEPHRGALIATLGSVSLLFGGLALCLAGLGVLISGPLGVAACLMANRDLARMRAGLMDPQGRAQTENGRAAGLVGLVLGVLFAAFAVLLMLAH